MKKILSVILASVLLCAAAAVVCSAEHLRAKIKTSEAWKGFTDDSMMCGAEATLSLRRLGRERLLFTLFRVQLFRRRKVGE